MHVEKWQNCLQTTVLSYITLGKALARGDINKAHLSSTHAPSRSPYYPFSSSFSFCRSHWRYIERSVVVSFPRAKILLWPDSSRTAILKRENYDINRYWRRGEDITCGLRAEWRSYLSLIESTGWPAEAQYNSPVLYVYRSLSSARKWSVTPTTCAILMKVF